MNKRTEDKMVGAKIKFGSWYGTSSKFIPAARNIQAEENYIKIKVS